MIASFLISPFFLLLATVGPELTVIDNTRFRVSITFDGTRARDHANAQIKLIKAAKKYCRGKGKAVSEGTLELNNAEPIKKSKKALELSEIYICVPKK